MISVKIDDSAVQQLQQRLAGLAPRLVADVYKARFSRSFINRCATRYRNILRDQRAKAVPVTC